MYPESVTYYNAPEIGSEHIGTLTDRLGRHPQAYGALYEAAKSSIDGFALGGLSLLQLQDLYDAAFPTEPATVLDTLPVTDTVHDPEVIDVGEPGFLEAEPGWDDLTRWTYAKWGRQTYVMLAISLVLQLERWTTFGEHGGRPPNP